MKVAIVTGSSSGVGAATALRLAREGWNVVVNYRGNREGAEAVVEGCLDAGADAVAAQADVADDAECRALVDAARERWGRLDALVNNAGTTKFCRQDDLDGLSADDFQRIYAVNVVGPYQMTRAAALLLREAGGSMVNVASMAGITGVGSSTAYAASKGALITMTKSLARALGPEVRVNAICPGFIQGSWLEEGLGSETYEKVRAQRTEGAVLEMTVTPEIVADGIVYFVAGAEGVTGETLMMDGGYHLGGSTLGRR